MRAPTTPCEPVGVLLPLWLALNGSHQREQEEYPVAVKLNDHKGLGGVDRAKTEAAVAALSDEQQAALLAQIDAVNLDEVTYDLVRVGVLERVEVQEERADGVHVTRYKRVPRIAEIAVIVPAETQMWVLDKYQTLNITGTPVAEQVDFMWEAVLKVWQESEPEMTLEELKRSGIDLTKLTVLFKRLFIPASLH